MINLKLAEYNVDGKFERFIELAGIYSAGAAFLFAKDYIKVNDDESISNYEKDEKDPLNRFNGLFDGRTFGEGRFVLIPQCNIKETKFSSDEIFTYRASDSDMPECAKIIMDGFLRFEGSNFYLDYGRGSHRLLSYVSPQTEFKLLGNLHQQPELWEKIK